MIVANLVPGFSSLLIALSLVSLVGMVLCLLEAESESIRQPPQPEPNGAFHLILRVLMRIASRSREAMVHMNTTYSPGEPGQWTMVGIALGSGGRGGGLPLPPYGSHARGTNRAMIPPPAKPGRFSGEILT